MGFLPSRRDPREFPHALHPTGTHGASAGPKRALTQPGWCSDLGLLDSRTEINKYLLPISPLSLQNTVITAEQTQTVGISEQRMMGRAQAWIYFMVGAPTV